MWRTRNREEGQHISRNKETVLQTCKKNLFPWGPKNAPRPIAILSWKKDHQVQLLALHRMTQNSSHMFESTVQTLVLWQTGAVTTALESLFQWLTTLSKNLFLTSNLTLHGVRTQLRAVPLGPVAVSGGQSSVLPLHSVWEVVGCHEASQ